MKRTIGLLSVAILAAACSSVEEHADTATGRHSVAVRAEQAATRTSLDGLSTTWSSGDRIALWAAGEEGGFVLDGQIFEMEEGDGSAAATFGAEIDDMADGAYDYTASYPTPLSAEGGMVRFDLPAVQDGSYLPACDIMTAAPHRAPSLLQRGCDLTLDFEHRMHMLKFYIPEEGNTLGEPVERIVVKFPAAVAGTVEVDMTEAVTTTVSGSDSIVLELATPLDENLGEALAFINPIEMGAAESFEVKVESAHQWTSFEVSGLNLAAGHVTPVKMKLPASKTGETYLNFSVVANNLGEPLQKLTLRGENVDAENGTDEVEFDMSEGEALLKVSSLNGYLDGRTLEVVYESDNALITTTMVIPKVTGGITNDVEITVPYLFAENFDSVEEFSSNDIVPALGFSSGTMAAVSFLDGWTGARIGAKANTSIRIASRRETSADYPARVDSAPMANLKEGASVNVTVLYDYGFDRREGGIGSAPKLGITVYPGYVTENTAFDSGSTDGTFNPEDEFHLDDPGATYDTMLNFGDRPYTIAGATKDTRLTWRIVHDHRAGVTNGTFWLYIDNVRVSITQ